MQARCIGSGLGVKDFGFSGKRNDHPGKPGAFAQIAVEVSSSLKRKAHLCKPGALGVGWWVLPGFSGKRKDHPGKPGAFAQIAGQISIGFAAIPPGSSGGSFSFSLKHPSPAPTKKSRPARPAVRSVSG